MRTDYIFYLLDLFFEFGHKKRVKNYDHFFTLKHFTDYAFKHVIVLGYF